MAPASRVRCDTPIACRGVVRSSADDRSRYLEQGTVAIAAAAAVGAFDRLAQPGDLAR